MARGVHGEKIVSAIQSNKMPAKDVPRLKMALQKYDEWIEKLNAINAESRSTRRTSAAISISAPSAADIFVLVHIAGWKCWPMREALRSGT